MAGQAAIMTSDERRAAVKSHKRALILDAAKAVFSEDGLDGATMRKIAKASGYTPAAIYFYFAGKEEIYAAILSEVLDDLIELMERAAREEGDAEARARAVLAALFDFYLTRPREFELSYYLFQGVRPRGLTKALNECLNRQLKAALTVLTEALLALGHADREAVWTETVACLTHVSGVVLLANSGRLKVLGVAEADLQRRFIDGVIAGVRGL